MLKKLCLGLGKASRALGTIVQGPQITGRQLTLVQLLPQGLWANTSNIKLHVSDHAMEGIERYVNKVDPTEVDETTHTHANGSLVHEQHQDLCLVDRMDGQSRILRCLCPD